MIQVVLRTNDSIWSSLHNKLLKMTFMKLKNCIPVKQANNKTIKGPEFFLLCTASNFFTVFKKNI